MSRTIQALRAGAVSLAVTASVLSPLTVAAADEPDAGRRRGRDWCNQNGAGLGAAPTVQPYGAADPIIGFVWIKPPGESDGDYPTASHSHGDPHCDPSGTNSDGNGGTGNGTPVELWSCNGQSNQQWSIH